MKALAAFGPRIDSLAAIELPTPKPGPGELLVAVHAVSVNPVDTKIRRQLAPDEPHPRVLGFDASGQVVACGPEVKGFEVGDEVYYSGDVTRQGTNAEFHVVDHLLVGPKPQTLSPAQAAALPLVTITAWQLLFDRMAVAPHGNNLTPILIINGAGGVGSAMIPLARAAGLKVIATASRPASQAWCYQLGAHHVIDHRADMPAQLAELGLGQLPLIANLYDTHLYWDLCTELLAPYGTLGLIVETHSPLHIGNPFRLKSPRIVWEYMPSRPRFGTADRHLHGSILRQLAALVDSGQFPSLANEVMGELNVANLSRAHQCMEDARAIGKLVLTLPLS